MVSHRSNACVLSLLLHASAVALVVLLAYVARQSTPESPRIFELVAGAGDNYGATVAPALGVPGGFKVTPPAPLPEPAKPVAQAEAPPPPPVQAKPQPKAEAVPDFSKAVVRAVNRKAARLEAEYKKQLEAEQRRQISYEQYLKEHKGAAPSAASRAPPKVSKIDSEGIREGVVGGSSANKTGGAGGRALTREEGDLLEAYFAFLKARIKENHVPPPGLSDTLKAEVEFYLAADGSISQVRITRPSGSADFDQSVLEAVRHTRSVGARPDKRGDTVRVEIRLRDEDAP